MKLMVRFFFWLFGWKIDRHTPEGVNKCVVAVGPHTSNWDFIIGKMAFISYGVNSKFLIKKSAFFFPLGFFLRRMGGIPVDRTRSNNLTSKARELFQTNDKLFLVFTPEGTRSYNPAWKKGFYYIAIEAKVPIYIAYIDYKRKIGGFHSVFEPTGDVERDLKEIKNTLSQYSGRYPENGIKYEE